MQEKVYNISLSAALVHTTPMDTKGLHNIRINMVCFNWSKFHQHALAKNIINFSPLIEQQHYDHFMCIDYTQLFFD